MNQKDASPLSIVLSVVDPDYPNNIQISDVVKNRYLFNESIKLATMNGLYYLFVNRLKELNPNLPFLDDKCWGNEEKGYIEFRNTLKLLNSLPDDINYILIKSCRTIPHVPRDVDIFVCAENAEDVLKFLEQKGMKYDQKCDGETSLKGDDLLRIDLYRQICYFNVNFFEEKFLLESIETSKISGIDCPCLNKNADFLLSLVHSIFGHGRISLLDYLYLKSLRCDLDINACERYASKNSWGQVFNIILNKFDEIDKEIYGHEYSARFPYLIDLDFIIECIFQVEGLRRNKLDRPILRLCLNFERFIELKTNSPIYNLCKSFPPTRKLANYSLSFFRTIRGDVKK